MNDDRLTPEERAVIEAALAWTDEGSGFRYPHGYRLVQAADAYRKATAPPEPFEAFVGYYTDDTSFVVTRSQPGGADMVYRCTVTPVERVR